MGLAVKQGIGSNMCNVNTVVRAGVHSRFCCVPLLVCSNVMGTSFVSRALTLGYADVFSRKYAISARSLIGHDLFICGILVSVVNLIHIHAE